ncbi:hypothetical protein O988_03006 [Pseudogymnoascus sp. VKM F-3808]|nr:hypothetical protein O988_03006 [Pseudogymnoascus sp. VKM F-3808]
MADFTFAKGFFALLRNLLVAALVYTSLYTIVEVVQTGRAASAEYVIKHRLKTGEPKDETKGVIFSPGQPPTTLKLKNINPHANWFNRPVSNIEFKDDYMGKRPDVDTVADITKLVETCRGSYEKLDKMYNRKACLDYLATGEEDYFFLPEEPERASAKSPRNAPYLNADGSGNTLAKYPKAKAASKKNLGACHGPIIPHHAYWSGPATWRFELFVKSYLYTQNLPCSRLWIWIDSDKDPYAIAAMMTRDPIFERMLPLIKRGDLVLKEWKFPSRIPLPKVDYADGGTYYSNPGKPNAAGEVALADGLVRDAEGQEWLVLSENQKTSLPVAVSDAVRFVVLHLYGGAYFDVDVILLRDMRPLLINPTDAFAERWGQYPHPEDYNTAVLSLGANTSLSSYFLRGGVRMGMNFHPQVIGLMAVKDKKNSELKMLESSFFDPIWWNYEGNKPCPVPCLRDYSAVFKGEPNAFPHDDEWEGYDGPRAEEILKYGAEGQSVGGRVLKGVKKEGLGTVKEFDRKKLAEAEYRIWEDNYPPTNRTLEHFFRGAWAYHVHNQWSVPPQPSSWFDVLRRAHNDFFAGKRTNAYGEKWAGPDLVDYEIIWTLT